MDSQSNDSDTMNVDSVVSDHLQDTEDPETTELESTVKKGIDGLENLQKQLEKMDVRMGNIDWKTEIQETLRFSKTTDVVIGVVGSTGAGKSTLINAIIHENILPKSCMRASTAVPTEISYNHGEHKYTAEIEFIKRDDWKRELEILTQELADNRGDVLRRRLQKGSEAAVAFEKMKAVYPDIEPEQLVEASVEELVNDANVAKLFGRIETFKHDQPTPFASKLKPFIDSGGGRRHTTIGKTLGVDDRMQLWPLIRVVRIYVKAQALSTGAILVDLPGVADSNPARVAVAEKYMKLCSAHWIVAPINRAVSDKVARDLLGENFKIQMTMDLALNDLTFICSKTDDICIGEVEESLDLDLPLLQEQRRQEEKAEQLRAEINVFERKVKEIRKELNQVKTQFSQVQTALSGDDLSEHLVNFQRSRKRKLNNSEVIQLDFATGTSSINLNSSQGDLSYVSNLLDSFRSLQLTRENLLAEHRQIEGELGLKKKEMSNTHRKIKELTDPIQGECIRARNDYSKKEIRLDFANSMRDLDRQLFEENVEEADLNSGTVEPANDRDYANLESSLPVFCISARAYQEITGTAKNQAKVTGFSDIEDTEIPALQRHCIESTFRARKTSARRFLSKLSKTLISIKLWVVAINPDTLATQTKATRLVADFKASKAKLRQDMGKLVQEDFQELRGIFASNIYDHLGRGAKQGSDEFSVAVAKWNRPSSEGGFHWQTYQAFCRRRGVFKHRSLNHELANPMISKVAASWTRTFATETPHQLQLLSEKLRRCLRDFHKATLNLAEDSIRNCCSQELSHMIKRQTDGITQHLTAAGNKMRTEQRDVNRLFVETISDDLDPAYETCAIDRGKGILDRMRLTMKNEAQQNGEIMFLHCKVQAWDGLEKLLQDTETDVAHAVSLAVEQVIRDYYTTIIEAQIKEFSDQQLQLKESVGHLITDLESSLHLDRFGDMGANFLGQRQS